MKWYEGLSEVPPFRIVDRRPGWMRWILGLLK